MVKFGEHLANHRFAFGDVVPANRYVDYDRLKELIYDKDTDQFLQVFLNEVAKVFRVCLAVCLEVDQTQCSRCTARATRLPQRKMQALFQYVRINREGCRKILKKFDKNNRTQVLKEYMTIVDALLRSAQQEVDRFLYRSLSACERRPRSSSCPPPPRSGPCDGDRPQHPGSESPLNARGLRRLESPLLRSPLEHSPTEATDVEMPPAQPAAAPAAGAAAGGCAMCEAPPPPPPPPAAAPWQDAAPAGSPVQPLQPVQQMLPQLPQPLQPPPQLQSPAGGAAPKDEMVVWQAVLQGKHDGASVGVIARSANTSRQARGTSVTAAVPGGRSLLAAESLVFDPDNKARYLVPESMMEDTAGWDDFVKKPKSFLCMLYQKGSCRAGRACNQLHVDRDAVATLRSVAGKARTFSAQGSRHFVSELRGVVDPATGQSIVIPFCKTEESAGRDAYGRRRGGGDWQLCTAHLEGTCLHGVQCKDIHVEPAHVVRVRQGDACCPDHCPDRAETPASVVLRVRVSGRSGDLSVVPIGAVCQTKGLLSLPQQQDGSRSFPIGKVCRLHQENRCDYGRTCNNVHMCRRLYAKLKPARGAADRGHDNECDAGRTQPESPPAHPTCGGLGLQHAHQPYLFPQMLYPFQQGVMMPGGGGVWPGMGRLGCP